ncbi:hypothetical protein [Nocardioides coralli]|uniref:hypothetical protein n=1 Tax=Nocardioides coralli TaxID=2872154 RepID=UPI001CA44C90|nr:hypothetical protein [Nocardioides coralli]QZY28213.1 hypothetical protein K6T13_12055 [Nocardioides coralli]
MSLSRHHTVALAAAGCMSAVAITDAVTHGLTGHYSVFSDESENWPALVLSAVVHGLAYVALAWVLLREGDRFAATNRVARATRWVVIACLGVLAAGFLLIQPFLDPRGGYDGALYETFGVLVGPAFLGMLLGSMGLGLALLRSPALGIGPRMLALMLPVLGVTVLLGWLAPAWAHPAYLETTFSFGLALLGVRATQPATRAAIASPTAAV